MRLPSLLAVALLAAGCGTVSVKYPGGHARPKLVAIQLYGAKAHNRERHGDIYHYGSSLAIEAGCAKAAFAAGQPMTVHRTGTSAETETTRTFYTDIIEPRRVSVESGADVLISGHARLTPSLRVESLDLEAQAADGTLVARADFSSDDGAEPFDAGERTCRALFAGWWWQPGVGAPKAPLPHSVFLIGDRNTPRNNEFRDGCTKSLTEAGVALLPFQHVPRSLGTLWQTLAQASGAEAFIIWTGSAPDDEPRRLSSAIAWRTDASGVVQDVRWYASLSIADPAPVGRELCRGLLKLR